MAGLCRKQAARDFYSNNLRRHSLRQWQLCARWSRDSGWKEDLAFHHCSETILIKAMDSWRLVRTPSLFLSGYFTINRACFKEKLGHSKASLSSCLDAEESAGCILDRS